jgi:hypothetical protein
MVTIHPQTLFLLTETFAICRLEKGSPLPQWVQTDSFFSITGTTDELSLVCPAESVPTRIQTDRGWRCFKLQGPFPFSLTGILNSVTVPLAQADIGIFAVSTYDTDYVLIKEHALQQALSVLTEAGHTIHLNP